MPDPNQPHRPKSPLDFGSRLFGRIGDGIHDGVSDARDWVDDRVADAKGAAMDVATRFPPVANVVSKLPPPFGVNDGGAAPAKPAKPFISGEDEDLTELSRAQESGHGGPGTISRGRGDHGGASYGTYQFASKFAVPQRLLATYGARWADRFKGKPVGSPAFDQTWKAIAQEDPEGFDRAQRAFIGNDYFKVQADMIRRHAGLDLSDRSRALKNAVYSTAVQHGPNSTLISGAILGLQKANPRQSLTDQQIIDAIYAERGRTDAQGRPVHFLSSDPKQWPGLRARFVRERKQAQDMLSAER